MYPENPNDFGFWQEKCYVKVLNYKEDAPVIGEELKTPGL